MANRPSWQTGDQPIAPGRYYVVLRVCGKNSANNWLSFLSDEEKEIAMRTEQTEAPDPTPGRVG
jgi:hypothetical protein